MNQHGDHVATCLCCVHCEMEQGWQDTWSGESASLNCAKGHFYVGAPDHKLVDLARECKDFKPKALK